jgi:glutathione S-transferase
MSQPAYTVIGHAKSRALRVLWAMEELGLPYAHVPALPRSEEARAADPAGRIPSLRIEEDGETATLTDSVAILTHLADRHGGLGHPAGTLARARQDAATQFVVSEMDAVVWALAKHAFALPEERRVPAVKDTLRWEAQRAERELETRLGDRPFLAGDALTVPDILAVHCLGWAAAAKVPVGSERARAWAAALAERPAHRRASAA